MTVRKTPNGRWRAQLKSGRTQVASRTFDTRREAVAWLTRERAALAGGIDPRAGKERVRDAMARWREMRRVTVSKNTVRIDEDLARVMPKGLQGLHVNAVTDRDIARCFAAWLASGLSERSAKRYRASLSSFFGWCVRERLISANPVTSVKVPKQSAEPVEMTPYTEAELEDAYERWRAKNEHLANVLLVIGWTGLRWSEARAVQVRDLMRVPTPGLMIRRSAPEGVGTKSTKGGRSRLVPLADRVLPIVLAMAEGKEPNDLLFTTARGAQLHRTPVIRSVDWARTNGGRRIHDLRHTAACLWLSYGVDVTTVQAWMGHESIATTNIYVHFLGTSAHRAGLERLNSARGCAGGAREGEKADDPRREDADVESNARGKNGV